MSQKFIHKLIKPKNINSHFAENTSGNYNHIIEQSRKA